MSGAAAAPAIRVAALAKTFAGDVKALDQVDFTIDRAQFVSVLGPSGCGKSTLLRILGGLLSADTGATVDVLDAPVAGPAPSVGIVFQTHNMLPWATVEANIRLAAEVRGMPEPQIAERVERIVGVLRLDAFRKRYPHELSGGMRQRAAFGQILILEPEVLLLDEPFGALDALTRDQMNVELLNLWQARQQTVVMITHSIAEAVFLSDRVLVMSDRPGRIVADITIECGRPRDPRATRESAVFTRHVLELSRMMGVL
ncbi:MAG: ABC transporter ATP-binding protein [Burkholderiales bacterium]